MTDSIDWLTKSEAKNLAKRLCFQFKLASIDIFDKNGDVLPYEYD